MDIRTAQGSVPVAGPGCTARGLGCSGMSWPNVHPPLSSRYHFLIFEMFEFLKSLEMALQKAQRFQDLLGVPPNLLHCEASKLIILNVLVKVLMQELEHENAVLLPH